MPVPMCRLHATDDMTATTTGMTAAAKRQNRLREWAGMPQSYGHRQPPGHRGSSPRPRRLMVGRAKTVIVSILVVLLVLVLGGITAIGWQIVLGPKARATTKGNYRGNTRTLDRAKN